MVQSDTDEYHCFKPSYRWGYQVVITSSEVMKTFQVVIKLVFLVFKKCKFPTMLCKITAKTEVF